MKRYSEEGSRSYALVGKGEDANEEWLERFSLNTLRKEIEKKAKKYIGTHSDLFVYLVDAEDNIIRTQFYLFRGEKNVE